jgi:FdhD protein
MDSRRSGGSEELRGLKSTLQVASCTIQRFSQAGFERREDQVAVEEPLQIRVSYRFKDARRVESAAVTMRTPGNEKELAMGFLLAEGMIASAADVIEIRALGSDSANEILVELADHVDVDEWHMRRATVLNSACGLCGKRTLEALPETAALLRDGPRLRPELLYRLPPLLRERQAGFGVSGGLHAAARVTSDGQLGAVFEDIGRHNALDKLIGHCVQEGLTPLSDSLLFISSRGSFELVQKALAAGCPVLATIGAPSSLAIEYAREREMTLIGFVRDEYFNVYAGDWRVGTEARRRK